MKDAIENQGQASVAKTDDPLFTAIIESALDYAIITTDVRGNVPAGTPEPRRFWVGRVKKCRRQ